MESHNIDNKKAIVPQEMIIYQSEDGAVKVDVQMADETVWLTIQKVPATHIEPSGERLP